MTVADAVDDDGDDLVRVTGRGGDLTRCEYRGDRDDGGRDHEKARRRPDHGRTRVAIRNAIVTSKGHTLR